MLCNQYKPLSCDTMASRDLLGILNGIRQVVTAGSSTTIAEVRHCLTNSSIQPCISSLCQQCTNVMEKWTKTEQDLDIPDFPPFDDINSTDWEFYNEGVRYNAGTNGRYDNTTVTNNSNRPITSNDVSINSINRRRFHTMSLHHQVNNDITVDESTTQSVKNRQAKERRVPASRVGRMVNFGGLAAGLGLGTAAEVARRTLGFSEDSLTLGNNPILTQANIERIVSTLCRVRGAALKIGQIISLQDNSLIPEPIQEIFERVRNNADFMPSWQMEKVLVEELGPDWSKKLKEFDPRPLAAASIGQVHRACLHDGTEIAMKIQYPGVAQSIDSDINNLMGVLKLWDLLPPGLFIDAVVEVARKELAWETDYIREATYCAKFRELLADRPGFGVPQVIPELTTKRVLTTELVEGIPLDKCVSLPQNTKDNIASRILELCLRELFEFQLMQTDPNWSNFYFNESQNKIYLLDFGASRHFPKYFTDEYLKIIYGSTMGDINQVIKSSKALQFLTGYESKVMIQAHIDAVMILGEPFSQDRPFDFKGQETTQRIHKLIPVLLEHRLTPPPEETYSLHRKMSGAFLLCTKLGVCIECRPMFMKIYDTYKFDDVR